MKKHIIWMIIGCGLPLLLIFFAPVLGDWFWNITFHLCAGHVCLPFADAYAWSWKSRT